MLQATSTYYSLARRVNTTRPTHFRTVISFCRVTPTMRRMSSVCSAGGATTATVMHKHSMQSMCCGNLSVHGAWPPPSSSAVGRGAPPRSSAMIEARCPGWPCMRRAARPPPLQGAQQSNGRLVSAACARLHFATLRGTCGSCGSTCQLGCWCSSWLRETPQSR